ncbi:copper oxidase [Anaerolineae bacterium CFX7]|nr:copper oxidase [Anaerolineae bacterium CFX7]
MSKYLQMGIGIAIVVMLALGAIWLNASAETRPPTFNPVSVNEPNAQATMTPDSMGGMDMGNMSMGTATPMSQSGDEMGGMNEPPVPDEGVPLATEKQGAQPLEYKLDNGVKVFNLTAKPVKWPITGDTTVTAWTYNGTVPGPLIRVNEGDKIRVVLKNELPEATSIHWHGLPVPNNQDGVAEPAVTQKPIMPGETYTYEFVAKPAGTYMYHSHVQTDRQIPIGLSAPLIIDPSAEQTYDKDFVVMLNEWQIKDGKTYAAMPGMNEPNYFTVNGKAFPDIPTINVKKGERVRVRLIGAGQFEHPMHLHGMSFKIVATDGNPVPEVAQLTKDTIPVHPGERFDVEFVADNPGQWAFHCHILHHVTNDNVEPGGLLFLVNVEG